MFASSLFCFARRAAGTLLFSGTKRMCVAWSRITLFFEARACCYKGGNIGTLTGDGVFLLIILLNWAVQGSDLLPMPVDTCCTSSSQRNRWRQSPKACQKRHARSINFEHCNVQEKSLLVHLRQSCLPATICVFGWQRRAWT